MLLEVNCSTDFVARSEDFKTLTRELALQIAGTNPKYVAFSDIPEEQMNATREQLAQDPEVLKRPEKLRAQIVEGKLKKQFTEHVLLEQPWVKDEKVTVGKLVDDVIRKTGENVVVRRFARFALGED